MYLCLLLLAIVTIVTTAREVDNNVKPTEDISSLKLQLQDEKVKIQLLYECLCPGCRKFDTTQFKDVTEKLQDYLEVHTYPYGNAKMIIHKNGTMEVKCQHGEVECYGNMLHACAIDILANITASIEFNACLMDLHNKPGSDDATADKCGKELGVDAAAIKECAKGPKGKYLLIKAGEESKNFNYKYVPFVLINGVEWDQTANSDFMNRVCEEFKEKPGPCK